MVMSRTSLCFLIDFLIGQQLMLAMIFVNVQYESSLLVCFEFVSAFLSLEMAPV